MDGPVLSEGARLEPLARDGEVLVSPQLRYRPEIEEARFLFHPLSRRIRKALGSKEAGESVRCYAVSLREASIP